MSDPPHVIAARNPNARIDATGFAFIAVGLGLLEYVLDKGLEDDWFASKTIVAATAVAAVSLVSFVAWEWNHPAPLLNLKLFKRRSFVVAVGLMVTLGIVAYGSTVLLPQYLQVLMGYTAQQAGLVLSPGGLVIFFGLPLVGRFVSKRDPRPIIAFGFSLVSASMFYTALRMNMQMDFATAVKLRCMQCLGMACLFVPIQTIAYAGMRPEQRGQIGSIMNLARNLGADFRHRVDSGASCKAAPEPSSGSGHSRECVRDAVARETQGARGAFQRVGVSAIESAHRSMALVYREVLEQAMQLAYLDAIRALAIAGAVAVPLAWLARPPQQQIMKASRAGARPKWEENRVNQMKAIRIHDYGAADALDTKTRQCPRSATTSFSFAFTPRA